MGFKKLKKKVFRAVMALRQNPTKKGFRRFLKKLERLEPRVERLSKKKKARLNSEFKVLFPRNGPRHQPGKKAPGAKLPKQPDLRVAQ